LTFSIDGGGYQTSKIFTGLAAGTHTLSVKDANACTQSLASVTITAPTAISGSGVVSSNYNGSQLSCATSTDGVITITASGGSGALTYSIDGGGYQVSNIFTGLAAGSHTLSVKMQMHVRNHLHRLLSLHQQRSVAAGQYHLIIMDHN
jgi:hypothetical protein